MAFRRPRWFKEHLRGHTNSSSARPGLRGVSEIIPVQEYCQDHLGSTTVHLQRFSVNHPPEYLVVLVLPSIAFQIPFLRTKWRQIGWAITDFREYMLEQLTEENRLTAEGKPGSGTLMSNLVRASEVQREVAGVARGERTYMDGRPHEMRPLSGDEILGNIFVFNFAGHDTTAISLAYSVLLLVAHPEVQEWIREELDFYLETDKSETWRYEIVFPRLKRCLAVLLRLHNVEIRCLVKANSQTSLRPCGYTIHFLVCLNTQAISLASSKVGLRNLSFLRIRLLCPIWWHCKHILGIGAKSHWPGALIDGSSTLKRKGEATIATILTAKRSWDLIEAPLLHGPKARGAALARSLRKWNLWQQWPLCSGNIVQSPSRRLGKRWQLQGREYCMWLRIIM